MTSATASAAVMTSKVRAAVLGSCPSSTTSLMVWPAVSKGRLTTAPEANGVAAAPSNQEKVSGSFSTSCDGEPSRTTTALLLLGEMTTPLVIWGVRNTKGEAMATATGGSLIGRMV